MMDLSVLCVQCHYGLFFTSAFHIALCHALLLLLIAWAPKLLLTPQISPAVTAHWSLRNHQESLQACGGLSSDQLG